MDDVPYGRMLFLGLIITVAVLAAASLYWIAEPARMQTAEENLIAETIEHGRHLYAENCVACHGPGGEGVPNVGPALNTQVFLRAADDRTIFDTIHDGRPGTAMPAWGQEHGGVMNAQAIRDLTAFIRSWEATAPETRPTPARAPNPAAGGVIFSTICFACHGINGEGTTIAPALNSADLLTRYGDDYFRETIHKGRPSRGMPTWGKVLSPAQIDDVVAFIRSWEKASPASPAAMPGGDPVRGAAVFSASCVVCHGENGAGTDKAPPLNRQDLLDSIADSDLFNIISEGRLAKGMPQWGRVLPPAEIGDVVAFIRTWEPLPVAVATPPRKGDVAAGARLYTAGCAACHGTAGEGAVGPSLQNSSFVAEADDQTLRDAIVNGIPGTSMPPWEGDLSGEDVLDLVALLRSWQGLPTVRRTPTMVPPTPTPEPPPPAGNVEKGMTLYAANCLACHGAQGEGGIGPALKGSSSIQDASDADLQAIIAGGRPGTAMPAFGGRLSEGEILDVVALIRDWED